MALDLTMYDTVIRYAHVMSAILWIGLLYFFNLIGGGFMKKIDATTKKEVYPKLYLPTLFWFRWAAMSTLVFGLWLYLLQVKNAGGVNSSWDFGLYAELNWGIHLGILIALTMWFNVWFVIWPAQREIIGGMLGKNPAPPDNVPRRAFLASRYNTFASFPMIFLMVSSSHWIQFAGKFTGGNLGIFIVVAAVLIVLVWGLVTWKPPVELPEKA